MGPLGPVSEWVIKLNFEIIIFSHKDNTQSAGHNSL